MPFRDLNAAHEEIRILREDLAKLSKENTILREHIAKGGVVHRALLHTGRAATNLYRNWRHVISVLVIASLGFVVGSAVVDCAANNFARAAAAAELCASRLPAGAHVTDTTLMPGGRYQCDILVPDSNTFMQRAAESVYGYEIDEYIAAKEKAKARAEH